MFKWLPKLLTNQHWFSTWVDYLLELWKGKWGIEIYVTMMFFYFVSDFACRFCCFCHTLCCILAFFATTDILATLLFCRVREKYTWVWDMESATPANRQNGCFHERKRKKPDWMIVTTSGKICSVSFKSNWANNASFCSIWYMNDI